MEFQFCSAMRAGHSGQFGRSPALAPLPLSQAVLHQRTARPTWRRCLDYVSQCSQAQWTHSPDFRGFSCVFLGMTVKEAVSYTHLRAHETRHDIVCRLLLEKKKKKK